MIRLATLFLCSLTTSVVIAIYAEPPLSVGLLIVNGVAWGVAWPHIWPRPRPSQGSVE